MARRLVILAIAAWSGYYVMAVELLSGRILAPSFGNSIYVWGGIITVFMLALSVGYLLGGQLSLYTPTLRRLGLVMIAAAVAALPVVLVGEGVLDWIFDNVRDPRYASLLASAALFFVPTAICGMVSPYAVRLVATSVQSTGRSAGFLYFISTFGSAAGTILTSFYMVLWFEVNQIFVAMIVVSLLFGLAAQPFRDAR
ncbi:MAG: fused MFS/spermidine synthase [Betaproteobacteria bacterium]